MCSPVSLCKTEASGVPAPTKGSLQGFKIHESVRFLSLKYELILSFIIQRKPVELCGKNRSCAGGQEGPIYP